ncbi:hypothetical protein [Nocardia carnea]|uniref:Uncharacterized protein n=1 Tax=Nocardia carnea TaxID=37328 RepID=A0ABW7TH78_9NOCA|nr:hypothetical protein [Nocardia carnea]
MWIQGSVRHRADIGATGEMPEGIGELTGTVGIGLNQERDRLRTTGCGTDIPAHHLTCGFAHRAEPAGQ